MNIGLSVREVVVELGLRQTYDTLYLQQGETLRERGLEISRTPLQIPPSIPVALRLPQGTGEAFLESVEPDLTGQRRGALYFLRKGFLYNYKTFSQEHVGERLKALTSTFSLVFGNLVIRILIQGIAYHFFKAVRLQRAAQFLDQSFACEQACRNYSYLKAIPAIFLHLAIFIIASSSLLIPGSSLIFNYMHGDIERWTVGHTNTDVANSSIGRRCHEAFYIARCFQPLAIAHDLNPNCSIIDITNDDTMAASPRRAFIRQITQQTYEPSVRPQLFEDENRVPYSRIGSLTHLVWRVVTWAGRFLDFLVSFPLHVCHISHKAGEHALPVTHKILYINGMYNSPWWAQGSTQHISTYGRRVKVTNVYNHTRGVIADAWKYLWAARPGFTPSVVTSRIVSAIQKFHLKNADDPTAQMLIFTHSGGTTELRNALTLLTHEERLRVRCVNLAPSAIIPHGADRGALCPVATHHGLQERGARDFTPSMAESNRSDLINHIQWHEAHATRQYTLHTIANPAFRPIITKAIWGYLPRGRRITLGFTLAELQTFLTAEEIQALTPEEIRAFLTPREIWDHFAPNIRATLHFTLEELRTFLTPEEIQALTPEEIRAFLTPEEIQAFRQ